MQKRGQATVFVAIGIVVIVLIALLFILLRPSSNITSPQNIQELHESLNICLQEQLINGITHPYFASFPSIDQSKEWLRNQTLTDFKNNCIEIIQNYPGAKIDKEKITSQISIQGLTLNEFEKISVTINAPTTITQGNEITQLQPITAEVYENQ